MPARKKPAPSAQLDIFDRPAAAPKKKPAASSKKARKKAEGGASKRKPKSAPPGLRTYTTRKGHRYELRRLS